MALVKITMPTKGALLKEISPETYNTVFKKTVNDLVIRAVPKVHTKLKRKWNVEMQQQTPYLFRMASSIDKSFSTKGGKVHIVPLTPSRNSITILADGSPINDKRFDYSFAKEMMSLRRNKRKLGAAKNRFKKASKVDKKRPRVKILKSKGATMLQKAFYAKMGSGHEGIFRRKGQKIIELRTITIASMYAQLDFFGVMDKHFDANSHKRFTHYMKRELR